MIIARMDTGGISYSGSEYVAAGSTPAAARAALADGFARSLVDQHGDGFDLAEYLAYEYGDGEDEPDSDLARLKTLPLEWFGVSVDKVETGKCYRDGVAV